jgi:hypothetical protein
MCTSHSLYLFLPWWASRLFPPMGFYKECHLKEHEIVYLF